MERLSRTFFDGTAGGGQAAELVADHAVDGHPGMLFSAAVRYAVPNLPSRYDTVSASWSGWTTARSSSPRRSVPERHRSRRGPAGRGRRCRSLTRSARTQRTSWVACHPLAPAWSRRHPSRWPSAPAPAASAKASSRPSGVRLGVGDQGGRGVEQHDVADRPRHAGHHVADHLRVARRIAAHQIGQAGPRDAEVQRVQLGPPDLAVGVDPDGRTWWSWSARPVRRHRARPDPGARGRRTPRPSARPSAGRPPRPPGPRAGPGWPAGPGS